MGFDADKTIKFWNEAAGNFDNWVNSSNRKPYDEIISLTARYLKREDNVLDFACGTGIITNEIAGSVRRVLAIDISDQMIEKGKVKAVGRNIQNVEYQVITIFNPGLKPGSFSVILAYNILHFFKDPDSVLTRIHQLLTPGGLLLSETGCFKERMSFHLLFVKMLSGISRHPYIKFMTVKELEKSFIRNRFELLETKVLFEKPVSCFIAARKV